MVCQTDTRTHQHGLYSTSVKFMDRPGASSSSEDRGSSPSPFGHLQHEPSLSDAAPSNPSNDQRMMLVLRRQVQEGDPSAQQQQEDSAEPPVNPISQMMYPWQLPPKPLPERILRGAMDSCIFKSIFSGVAGTVLGSVIGAAFSSIDLPPDTVKGFKAQMKFQAKNMTEKGWQMGKSFGLVGALYTGTECTISRMRAKHDLFNSVAAGCMSGAILARSGMAGANAMVVGCGGFAAFSVGIDYFMGR